MKNVKPKKLYKFLREGMKSDHGDHTWVLSQWHTIKGDIKLCTNGFHASKTPLQALGYVHGEILAEVEVRGVSDKEDDKEAWSEMRIVKAYHWTKEDLVSLAIFAAEQVIDIFEKKYPKDDRPRKAIEAAQHYLEVVKKGGNKNAAADAADAAADDAAAAAVAVADVVADVAAAAAAAANAAYAAYADAAADVAVATIAAVAAAVAAYARKKLVGRLDKWFIKRIKTLKEYK